MRTLAGKLYDADDSCLNLGIMEKLMNNPGVQYGNWFTRKPFRVEINYYENMWYADLFWPGRDVEYYSDTNIFNLILTILENHGR